MNEIRQGPHGPQGTQGVPGIQGVQGEGIKGDKGDRGEPGKPWKNRNVTLSFWAVVLVSMAIVGWMGYQMRETRHLAAENRDRIAEAAVLRDRLAEGLKAADRHLCDSVELLKRQRREDARKTFSELDRNLRLLNIEKTKEIVDIAERNRDRVLRRNVAIDCGSLAKAK